MSKRSRLQHEVVLILKKDYAIHRNKSKHVEKMTDQLILGGSAGRKSYTGIRCSATYDTYRKQAFHFVDWCVAHHNTEIRWLIDCRKWAAEYLEACERQGNSAGTLHTRLFALAKVFRCDAAELGYTCPKRRRRDIRRSRERSASDARVADQKYDTVKRFAEGTGLRREGMQRVHTGLLVRDKNLGLCIYIREKGGKERIAKIHPDYLDTVMERFHHPRGDTAHGKTYLFAPDELPAALDIHDCRSKYAMHMYEHYAKRSHRKGKTYRCRLERRGEVFDKDVLMKVSKDLGHSRCDVVVNHYLRPGFGLEHKMQ